MSLSLAKSVYSAGERLLYTQLNAALAELLKAVDGTGGGTYSPSAKISIQGSNGLEIAGTGSGEKLRYGGRDVTRKIPASWATQSDPAVWARTAAPSNYRHWQHLSNATPGAVDFDLPLPHGQVLKTITVRYDGGSGGSLPAAMPSISVVRMTEDGTETTIQSQNDTSANNAAYIAAHDITLAGIAHTIDATANRYYLRVTGGTGGGQSVGSIILEVEVVVTITSQSEWL